MASLLMTGDMMLRMQFDTAFTQANAPQTVRQSSEVVQPVAATEDYWLGDVRRSVATPAAWNRESHVAIGDRISLTIQGLNRELQVVAVDAVPTGLLKSGRTGAQFGKSPILVTLRAIGTNEPEIHLLLEGERDLQGYVRVSERAHEL